MKIKGWEKLNGITYKGYCILNPIHNAIDTQYIADVMFLETKEKLLLRLNTEDGYADINSFLLTLEDKKNKVIVNRVLNLAMLQSISNFRMMFEMCIEDFIKEVENPSTLQSMPKSSSVLPTFDDFVKMWRTTPVGQFTQTLIEK